MADRDQRTRVGPGPRVRLRFAADDRLIAWVRRGDATAFEILYDRHVRELLSFCRYMLGSQADAEDAVQSTFASAHRALLADDRAIDLRPWLFTIARNACLSTLRGRRPVSEVADAWPSREDPVAQVEQREDMRQVIETLQELPEAQRTALVLSELHGFSQSEIGTLLGVRPEQVKSYVYQARTNLISEREARGADCRVIREELTLARGPALLKSRLRRHLRSCPDCREYAAAVARQRHQLGILLPAAPLLALKRRALHAVLEEGPQRVCRWRGEWACSLHHDGARRRRCRCAHGQAARRRGLSGGWHGRGDPRCRHPRHNGSAGGIDAEWTRDRAITARIIRCCRKRRDASRASSCWCGAGTNG